MKVVVLSEEELEVIISRSIHKTLEQVEPSQREDSVAWMSPEELCEYLPWHPTIQSIYAKTRTGNIPFYKTKAKTLAFLKSEIDDWIKSGKGKTDQDIIDEAENVMLDATKK